MSPIFRKKLPQREDVRSGERNYDFWVETQVRNPAFLVQFTFALRRVTFTSSLTKNKLPGYHCVPFEVSHGQTNIIPWIPLGLEEAWILSKYQLSLLGVMQVMLTGVIGLYSKDEILEAFNSQGVDMESLAIQLSSSLMLSVLE